MKEGEPAKRGQQQQAQVPQQHPELGEAALGPGERPTVIAAEDDIGREQEHSGDGHRDDGECAVINAPQHAGTFEVQRGYLDHP